MTFCTSPAVCVCGAVKLSCGVVKFICGVVGLIWDAVEFTASCRVQESGWECKTIKYKSCFSMPLHCASGNRAELQRAASRAQAGFEQGAETSSAPI